MGTDIHAALEYRDIAVSAGGNETALATTSTTGTHSPLNYERHDTMKLHGILGGAVIFLIVYTIASAINAHAHRIELQEATARMHEVCARDARTVACTAAIEAVSDLK